MNCSICGKSSDTPHINDFWFCPNCSKDIEGIPLETTFGNSLFEQVKELYTSGKNRKILIVSAKSERLDAVGEYVLSKMDLFNLSNNITLIHAEGVMNLQAFYTDIFVDKDPTCEDWEKMIPRAENSTTKWIATPTWEITTNERSFAPNGQPIPEKS